MFQYRNLIVLILFTFALLSCQKEKVPDQTPPPEAMYFPPITGTTWETKSATALGWNQQELDNLDPYLLQTNTKAFIILQNGRIVKEKYFGSFTADSLWYWASAGKTMTAYLVGIAQEKGLLKIEDKTSKYLGTGWTTAPLVKENLITVRHQLTMSSGLDDGVPESGCTLPACLQYKADAGTRWSYHNAPYTLLDQVVENSSGMSYNAFFQANLRNKIGMNGIWIKGADYNNVLYSNARSMARYGLLLLNKGKWDKDIILADQSYISAMTNTSQNLNESYGYLTWLNGKATSMVPTSQVVFNQSLITQAPADMYAALGKNDQKVYVVPSKNLVVIRMGNASGTPALAVSGFDNELWSKLTAIIK